MTELSWKSKPTQLAYDGTYLYIIYNMPYGTMWNFHLVIQRITDGSFEIVYQQVNLPDSYYAQAAADDWRARQTGETMR